MLKYDGMYNIVVSRAFIFTHFDYCDEWNYEKILKDELDLQ